MKEPSKVLQEKYPVGTRISYSNGRAKAFGIVHSIEGSTLEVHLTYEDGTPFSPIAIHLIYESAIADGRTKLNILKTTSIL